MGRYLETIEESLSNRAVMMMKRAISELEKIHGKGDKVVKKFKDILKAVQSGDDKKAARLINSLDTADRDRIPNEVEDKVL